MSNKLADNFVVSGDYKNRPVVVVFGKVYILAGLRHKIKIDSSTVESYELLDSGKATGQFGNAVVGAALFGPAGAVIGANTAKGKNGILVSINFKDGKRSLVECDNVTYSWIVKACYKGDDSVNITIQYVRRQKEQ